MEKRIKFYHCPTDEEIRNELVAHGFSRFNEYEVKVIATGHNVYYLVTVQW